MELRPIILDVLIQHLPLGGDMTETLYAIADQLADRLERHMRSAAVTETEPVA